MSLVHLFFPRTLKFPDTPYNQDISLRQFYPQPTLIVGGLIQSGDILTHIWRTGLKKLLPRHFSPRRILILGIGGGSNTLLCRQFFPQSQITAVDIDPLMIQIAKKYFGLNRVKNLTLIMADALDYAASLKKTDQFDLILLDCFEGKYIPSKLENLVFIQTLKEHSRYLLINRIYWFDHREATLRFLRHLASKFFFLTAHTRSNVLISLV